MSKNSVTSYFLYSPYQFVESNFLLLVMSAKAEKRVLNTNILVQPRRWKRSSRDQIFEAVLWVCFVGTLILIFGPALLAHVQRAADPLIFNDDARAWIYPFYRYSESALFPRDYNGDYHLAISPWGYSGLYMIASYLGVATELSKIRPLCRAAKYGDMLGDDRARVRRQDRGLGCRSAVLGKQHISREHEWRVSAQLRVSLARRGGSCVDYSRYHTVGILVLLGAAFYPVTAVQIGIALALVLLASRRTVGEVLRPVGASNDA